jgi:hypothetical protein
MNLILSSFHFASVQCFLRRVKVMLVCARDEGDHAKHGRMRVKMGAAG